jgi:hypothetical protein
MGGDRRQKASLFYVPLYYLQPIVAVLREHFYSEKVVVLPVFAF